MILVEWMRLLEDNLRWVILSKPRRLTGVIVEGVVAERR